MDTDVLRWFQRVADGMTVTEVSELDEVTQSGVSRALARLESEVGTPLLRRSGRTLRLTRAGEVFKPHVDSMLRRFDDGIAAVGQFVSPETGTVALAFQQSLGTWLVPDLVRSFRARHPSVQFFRVCELPRILRVRVPQEVPGRIDESVERIRYAVQNRRGRP